MAWRIEESVIRGEIDNRVRGRVTGRIWFEGRRTKGVFCARPLVPMRQYILY